MSETAETSPSAGTPPQTGGEAREEKIVVKDLYKIFGPNPDVAYDMLQEGQSKDEIFERTGMTVGVQRASFTVYTGEVFVVMGLSGSGKSTLVRMLNRLIDMTYGDVFIDGNSMAHMPHRDLIELRRRDMSMVFQSFALMPDRTVVDNAAFGLEVAGVGREERTERALEALQAVGLRANANSYPGELSGGMQQRVGLARALATDPSIMLMDEAFSALDPLIRVQMQDELVRLQHESQRTVVFISHDLDEAMRIGDRIAVMGQDGAIAQIGTPEEILRAPANDYVASFFRGVDVSNVFSARDLADHGGFRVFERPGVNLRAALQQLRDHDRDLAIVVDRGGKYQGLVSEESLVRELRREDGEPQYANAFLEGVVTVPEDMDFNEVLQRVADSNWPVVVLDENGRYVGDITKTALLQTLNRTSS